MAKIPVKRIKGRSPEQYPGYGFRSSCLGKTWLEEALSEEMSERGEGMLMTAIPTEHFEGLLSWLNAQSELSEFLEELFYEGLN